MNSTERREMTPDEYLDYLAQMRVVVQDQKTRDTISRILQKSGREDGPDGDKR